MNPDRHALRVLACVVALAAPMRASAGPAPEQWAPLAPAVVEYRWTFLAPAWVVEARTIETRVYAPEWRSKRVDYALPGARTERRRVGRVAAFECKYADLALPNECRTTWRDVYADIPLPVVRHDYMEIEIPVWSWQDRRTVVEVPRVVWKEETLIVSVPAWRVSASGDDSARPASE